MSIPSRPLTVVALLAALVAPAANAQDVQYSTVTKVDLGGGMNAILKMAGASEVKETAYIKGKKLRSDSDKQSVIFDLDKSRYISINHSDKTYTSVPLADMMAVPAAAMQGVKADESKAQLTGTAKDSAGNKADYTVDVKIDPTKQRRNINGNDAEQVLFTMETNVRVTPQGQTQSEEAGTLVVLMDTWNANTGPASDAVRAFEQAASKEIAAAAFAGRRSAGLGPTFSANPGMADAMKKAQEEARNLDGIAVLSTMHLVIVAPGKKFDRDLALGTKAGAQPEQKRGGFRGMIGKAIESSTKQQEQKPAEEKSQATFAKVTTEIRDVKSTSVPDSMFDVPAGYREVKYEPPKPASK